MGERFEHQGFIYESLGDGNARVIGPAPQRQGPVVIGTPAPQRSTPVDPVVQQGNVLENQFDAATMDARRRQEEAAAIRAEQEAAAAVAANSQRTAQQGSTAALDTFTRILGQIDAIEADARDNGGWFETGWTGSLRRDTPGSAAYDLAQNLKTIDANSAFSALAEMRANSPTGAALGAITERELDLLKSTIANLNPDQSQESFLNNLRIAREHYTGILSRLPGGEPALQAYERGEGPISLSQSPGAGIPRVAGSREDPGAPTAGVAPVGSADTLRRDPRLAGLSGELRSMLANGASLRDVQSHFAARRAQAGYGDDPAQSAMLAQVHARLQANPRANLNTLATGWENFETVKGEEAPSGLRAAAGSAADTGLGAFVTSGLNSMFAGAPAQFVDGGTSIMDSSRYERPITSMAGDITGAVGSMIGINRVGGMMANGAGRLAPAAGRFLSSGGGIGGDALYGAARGAIDAPEGTEIAERAVRGVLGAGAGAAGNAVGRGIVSGTGRAVRGVSDPAVRMLSERGVPLTLGQIMGNRGPVGRMLNRAESAPVLGDLMGARRTDGFEGFARAANNDAVAPINMTAGPNIGESGVDDLLAQTRQGYDNALNGVSIPRDAQLGQGLASASARVAPDNPFRGDFDRIMGEELRPSIFGGPTINGRQFQDINRSTRAYARRYRDTADSVAPPQPSARPVGQAFGDIADTFDDALARSNPDALPAYRGAQQAYRNVGVIRDATNAARNGSGSNQTGLFTPSQLSTAAARNAQKYGGTQGTTNQPFFELTRAGQEVLPSTIPDSGTAGRLATFALPAALTGGAAASGYSSGDVVNPTTATLAALAALSTRGGSKALQTALVSRSPVFQQAGGRIIANRRYGGMFGAAGGSATTPIFLPELLAGQ